MSNYCKIPLMYDLLRLRILLKPNNIKGKDRQVWLALAVEHWLLVGSRLTRSGWRLEAALSPIPRLSTVTVVFSVGRRRLSSSSILPPSSLHSSQGRGGLVI
jgi:hypothetical protein